MKAFTQIAVPHRDVAGGRLFMDVFAADLWQVVKGEAPIEYQDPDIFFRKTYQTEGLKNILEIAKARLEGKSGDSTIQLQTPFGGGKTHTLIALYHKVREWGYKVAVIDGTALNPKEAKIWEEIERQLTGKVELTKGEIAPGKEKLYKLLSEHSPVLILMDELLEYATKAGGIKIGDSNLASQTSAFMQELTGAVSTVGRALLVVSLPSSIRERYDENAERIFQQFQKILGRVEKIYTPVRDEEIEYVIRARIFEGIDEKEVKIVVDDFIEYAKRENLLTNDEVVEYREKFLKSYPFKPEVIDILYKRWGSFPTFQRTRGVLRLLSLVVHDLMDKNLPFIRLGDFNLENQEIRRELIKHIGQEWDSIIAQDITSKSSGAKRVDKSLGSSYRAYKLGTLVTTTIFMSSFSGRGEKGISPKEIRLYCVYPAFSSTVIDTVLRELKEKLFYLSDEGYYFTNQPNLNKIIVTRETNISEAEILEEERRIIERHLSKSLEIRVYLFPKFSGDIPDTAELKLIILNNAKPEIEFLEKCGEIPRVNRNLLIFLCRDETYGENFYNYLRKYLALRSIEADEKLRLTENQQKEVKNKLKTYEQREYDELRKFYKKLYLPTREGFKEIDLGIAIYGEKFLNQEIYQFLKNHGEILEKVSPKVIKEKYLSGKDFIPIRSLYETFLRTPGELRLVSKEGYITSIKEGVKMGLFGFGYLRGDLPECVVIGEAPKVDLTEDEIITQPKLCEKKEEVKMGAEAMKDISEPFPTLTVSNSMEEYKERSYMDSLDLSLLVSHGKLSPVGNIISLLWNKFEKVEVTINIKAENGKLEKSEYEDKILEALRQAGIKILNSKN